MHKGAVEKGIALIEQGHGMARRKLVGDLGSGAVEKGLNTVAIGLAIVGQLGGDRILQGQLAMVVANMFGAVLPRPAATTALAKIGHYRTFINQPYGF